MTPSQAAQSGASWLIGQFVDSTHLPAVGGDHFDSKYGNDYYPNYGENADVIFGLAAANTGASKIATALNYLETNLDAYADLSAKQGGPNDGSVAKTALAVMAAGVAGKSATSFGGHNLLATLVTDECTSTIDDGYGDGGFICVTAGAARNVYSSISESLVIIARARAGAGFAPSAAGIAYLDSLQCSSGGFTSDVSACGSGAADIDATSYAVMALSTLDCSQNAQLAKAVSWLKAQQSADGSWVNLGAPNANSTGLAAAALASVSVNVDPARTWLTSQQISAGSPDAGAVKFAGTFTPTTTSATSPSVLATAQAITGLATNGSLATLGSSSAFPRSLCSTPSAQQEATHTVTATGFAPGEQVDGVLHSDPVSVGTATASPTGAVSLSFAVPTSVPVGAHTLTLTGRTSEIALSTPVTVAAAAVVPTPTATPVPTPRTAATATPAASATPADSAIDATTIDATSAAAKPATAKLAETGTDGRMMTELSLLASLAVLVGVALVAAARRRTA